MTQTILAITQADLSAIEQRLADLQARLDQVEMAPRREWLTVEEYASSIGRTVRTVRRRIEKGELVTREECGVTLIKAPR